MFRTRYLSPNVKVFNCTSKGDNNFGTLSILNKCFLSFYDIGQIFDVVTASTSSGHFVAASNCIDRIIIGKMVKWDIKPSFWHLFEPNNENFLFTSNWKYELFGHKEINCFVKKAFVLSSFEIFDRLKFLPILKKWANPGRFIYFLLFNKADIK